MSTNAPASTYVLVVGIMAAFSAFGIVLSFTPSWYWFMIPVALALPVLGILARRWHVRQQMRRELAEAMQDLG